MAGRNLIIMAVFVILETLPVFGVDSGSQGDRRLSSPEAVERSECEVPRASRILVRLKGHEQLADSGKTVGAIAGEHLRRVNKLKAGAELDLETRGFRNLGIEVLAGRDLEVTPELLNALRSDDRVEFAEPDVVRSTCSTQPNDPYFSELWGLHDSDDVDINAPQAWDVTTGSDDVIVGVVDTGIDYNHEDLAANIWVNAAEIPFNGVDDDGNGFVDDYHGWNAVSDYGDPMDDNGHGTHCAGTIGARGNNNIGVAGVAWNVKLMALKFLGSNGSGYDSDALECFDYVITQKRRGVNIRVLSNSWGSNARSIAHEFAIGALEREGILFVAAAGNSSYDTDYSPHYPASAPNDNVVSVGAFDGDNEYSYNFGKESVDLMAPGRSIYSTFPRFGALFEGALGDGSFVFSTGAIRNYRFDQSSDGNYGRNDLVEAILARLDASSTLTSILIVRDEGGGAYYTEALEEALGRLGYNNVTVHDVPTTSADGPSLQNMAGKVVFWSSGYSYQNPVLTEVDQNNLLSFISGGGRVFFTGRMAYDLDLNTDFLDNLSLAVVTNNNNGSAVEGVVGSPFEGWTGAWWYSTVGVESTNHAATRTLMANALYQTLSGTSMATPHVAGAAALVLAKWPDASWVQVKRQLLRGAQRHDEFAGVNLTDGRLDAAGALTARGGSRAFIYSTVPAHVNSGKRFEIYGDGFGHSLGSVVFAGGGGTTVQPVEWTAGKITVEAPCIVPGASISVEADTGVSEAFPLEVPDVAFAFNPEEPHALGFSTTEGTQHVVTTVGGSCDIIFSVDGLPTGIEASQDGRRLVLSGVAVGDGGRHEVRVTATDGRGYQAARIIDAVVARPILLMQDRYSYGRWDRIFEDSGLSNVVVPHSTPLEYLELDAFSLVVVNLNDHSTASFDAFQKQLPTLETYLSNGGRLLVLSSSGYG